MRRDPRTSDELWAEIERRRKNPRPAPVWPQYGKQATLLKRICRLVNRLIPRYTLAIVAAPARPPKKPGWIVTACWSRKVRDDAGRWYEQGYYKHLFRVRQL